jgi:hypothetical protein
VNELLIVKRQEFGDNTKEMTTTANNEEVNKSSSNAPKRMRKPYLNLKTIAVVTNKTVNCNPNIVTLKSDKIKNDLDSD